jgi:nucleoside-diphosphate-sugar epimerase
MKTKVLVCGATGFIGRNIVESFAKRGDFEVYGTYLNSKPLDNPRIKMMQVDLTNKEGINRVLKGMDLIIQVAATTSGAKDIITKPYYHVADNAVMNSLMFRAAH